MTDPAAPAFTEPAWKALLPPPVETWSRPEEYIVDRPLELAVETALRLGLPLLVTGEPGCGKTELANYLAWKLGTAIPRGTDAEGSPAYEYALRFDIKSDTRARDLFYGIDLVERFHAGGRGGGPGSLDPLNFIRFNALGRALIYARPPDELAARLLPWQAHPGTPQRSVVLIDEIDKAPSDVPNDLLMEVEKMRFVISEMNRVVEAPPALRPILIVTSNTERPLPDAFLRRCAYYHIPFPEPARLIEIVATKLRKPGEATAASAVPATLVEDATAAFLAVRKLPLRKKPATAELLGFVHALLNAGFGLADKLGDAAKWEPIARVTLLKTREDQAKPFPPIVPLALG